MKAEELRAITLSKKVDLDYILNSMKNMANDGNHFASFSLITIRDVQGYKTILEADGYTVTVREDLDSFKITW